MSGVGSTNAMKKGSANNPFLAYSEADMQGFLNSAYTGCIVKYAGEPISRYLTEQNKTVPEHAQNLVFSLIDGGFWTFFDSGNMRIKIQQKTNGSTKTLYITPGRYYNRAWHFNKSDFTNGNLYLTDSLTVPTEIPTAIQEYFSTEPHWRWNKECVNDQGNLIIWMHDQDVTFTIEQANTEYGIAYDSTHGITIVPYKVNELYKVVYGDGKYYYEEFYHISDTRTTANSDYIAPGKTAFDFTGNLQTGTGSKINPYLAYTVAEFQSFPVGSFIKWLGPGKTVIDTTTGQMLIHGEVYRAVEDGDILQYVILPTLSNPGKAADLAQGKQLIDGDGKVVEGAAVPGDTPLTLTQEKMMLGQSTVYSTDAKYITYNVPSVYKSTLVGVDAPNCEFIYSGAFCSSRWEPSGSLSYSYSNPAYVPFTLNLPKCKYIGSSAFSNITKMSNIYLPEAEVIEDYAFAHFQGTRAFGDIPHTLYIPKCKKLGDYVFANRSQLSGVLDCLELEEIGASPFSSTRGVTLNFDPSKIKRLSKNWWTNISTSAINFSNIYLPNCIEFAMGSGKNVRTADLPNCTILGDQAFYLMSCSSISLPKCETIGSSAFAQFNNSSIILSLPNAKYISDRAFSSCNVSSIYCPNLKYIGSSAFYNCRAVNITLPTSDLQINSTAFSAASILSTCSIYEDAYFINPEVVIYVASGRHYYSEWSNSTVKVLPDYTFGWWGSSLNTVRLDAIESLPYGFCTVGSIKNLIAPNLKTLNGDLEYLTSFNLPNVESISSTCNYFGQYVSYIDLPKLRGSITCQHFGAGTAVLSYNLGKVTQLGYEAFRNARISLYDFPALRDTLPRGCINNGNLLKVWLPCVTNIDWGTCQSCTKLSTVLLRSFSSYQGGSTFSGCTALSTFIVTAPEAFSFYSNFASGTPIRNGGGSIYVRASLINSFKALANANRATFFSSRFTALENLPADVYNTLPMPFDIGSLNYAMTRGSTFEEFCNSEFNAEDYVVYNGYVYTSDKTMRVAKDGVPVKPTDIAVDYDYIKYELIE